MIIRRPRCFSRCRRGFVPPFGGTYGVYSLESSTRALEAGARGYLLKSMPPKDMVAVIRQVHAGKKRIPSEIAAHLAEHMGEEELTSRELEVLKHIAGGNRNRDIAERLFVAEETVKVHVKHIMDKLGAKDRTEAVAIAVRRGIIQL